MSANGSRLRFTRDVGNVTMDVNGIEHVNFAALGGADTITVNDLSGTAVTQVNLDLAAPPARLGDGQADRSSSTAPTATIISTSPAAGPVSTVSRAQSRGDDQQLRRGHDALMVNALGGNDTHQRRRDLPAAGR